MCIIVPFYFRYFAVGKETFSKALGIVCGMTAWGGHDRHACGWVRVDVPSAVATS